MSRQTSACADNMSYVHVITPQKLVHAVSDTRQKEHQSEDGNPVTRLSKT